MAVVDNGTDPTGIDAWWVGHLAGSIAAALNVKPLEGARFVLERSLRDFKRSPACTPEVRRALSTEGREA